MLFDVNMMVGDASLLPHAIPEQAARKTLDLYGIDKAVVYHAEARYYDVNAGNLRLLAFTKSTPGFFPSLVLSPGCKSPSGSFGDMARLVMENGVRFVRLLPAIHGYSLGGVLAGELFSFAEENRLVLMLDMEEATACPGAYADSAFVTLCRRHPRLRVILTRCLHRKNQNIEYYLQNLENVYIEPSITNNWLFYEQTVRRFGEKRLLWGSSMPFNNPGCSVSMLAYADISDAARERIARGNLLELL